MSVEQLCQALNAVLAEGGTGTQILDRVNALIESQEEV